MRPAASWLAAAALVAACANTSPSGTDLFPALPQAGVEIATATGNHRFRVWIAADDRSRTRGLMFVRELPADRGMLFLFQTPQPAAFWMKDTYIPLDLVFIDPTGRVLNIGRDARPFSLAPIESDGPVIAVLEVRAGTAARIGLAPGDRVQLPTLRTTFANPERPAGSERPESPF
jgi:uncharacterized membrane protein (UPF0127 family)